jgi:cytochrome P450
MKPLPPSPPPIPTLARLARDPLGAMPALQREHGDLYYVSLPGVVRTCIVTHPEQVHQVLVRDFRSFRKDFVLRSLGPALGEGLLLAEGDEWRRRRRLSQPGFHSSAIAGYAEAMTELAAETVAGWGPRRELDVHAQMMRLTLRIVGRTLFGQELGADADTIGHALDALVRVHKGVGSTSPLLPLWVPTPTHARWRRALRAVDGVIFRTIERHRREPVEGTLLGMLIAATDEGGGLTDRQLRDEAVTLLMAGHETTAVALTFALYLLSQHPEVEERLHAEVDALPHAPGLADVPRLPYARAVVAETLRLFPPAWAMGREALEDVELGGYRVPKGTHLWLAPWVTHRDARWYADPEAFRPERWFDGELERSLPDGAYHPFGLGPRSCIGKRFAELEAVLVLATVAREHALRLSPGETLRLFPTITLRPEHGVRMIATRRPARRQAA